MPFDYKGARESGYSDDEIIGYLSENNPKFDVKGAFQAGYSPDEITQFLNTPQEKGVVEKGARTAGQYALGAIEGSPSGMAYDIAVAPLSSKSAQTQAYRQNVGEDIERLIEQKSSGQWDQQDEALLKNLTEQMQDFSKSEEFSKTADLSIRGLAEKATGQDLKPEGALEKAAHWAGILKNPKDLAKLAAGGIGTADLIKAFAPSGKEVLRGLGAGIALEGAEDGEYGPIGTMAAAIVGDLIGGGVASLGKGAAKFASNPKKYLSEIAAKFTPKDKLDMQKEIINDFREAGIQADLGSITDNNLIKWTQSRIAQSGLTGKALDEFKENLVNQIKNEYKELSKALGEAKSSSAFEVGEIAREGIKKIRDADLAEIRNIYKTANNTLIAEGERAFVEADKLRNTLFRLEKELTPGNIKSSQQNAVLDSIRKLNADLFTPEGKQKLASVKDLMNNKIALNDIINYEVQGGTKQLLKEIVADLDRAIISHGKENPAFARNYINANKRFAEHAKTFRNKNIDQLLKAADPATAMNKMNSVQGIKNLEKVLGKTQEGKDIFNSMKRMKMDNIIGDSLGNSALEQAKLGKFSNILKSGKNKEVVKEILGAKNFKRLEKLLKNSSRLADAANKFYNTSQSGVVAADVAILSKAFGGVLSLLSGNPWPIVKTGGLILGAKKLGNLLADPEFLKLTEDAILAMEKGNQANITASLESLKPYLNQLIEDVKQ